MKNSYNSYKIKSQKRKKHRIKSHRKKRIKGGEGQSQSRQQGTMVGNVKETVRIIGVGTTQAVKRAADETLQITDKTLQVTGNTIRDSLDTIEATEKAINTSLQETVGLVAETTKSAANISKDVLKTTESLARSGLGVADVTMSNAASVANTATTQSAKVANTALKHASELTSTSISAASNTLFALLGTVSNTVEEKTDKIRARQESMAEYYSAKQLNELNNKAKEVFSERISILKRNIDEYVSSQRGFIELSLNAFKMNKCNPGRVYGHTCSGVQQGIISDFKSKLKVLEQNANANKKLLDSLSTKAGSALVTIYGEDIDPRKYKTEANKKLAPFYAEASKIFEKILEDSEELNKELDARLKENLKEIKDEVEPTPSLVEREEEESSYSVPGPSSAIEGGRWMKTKRLKKNKNTKSANKSRKRKRVKRKYNKK